MMKRLAIAASALGLAAMAGLTTASPASASTEITTENWNGYITNGSATEVVAYWTVPSLNELLSIPAVSNAAEWIGLGGGPGSNPTALVQIGTHQTDLGSWSPFYEIIYGSYDSGPVYGTQTLKAGNAMEAYVQYQGGGHYYMSLYDATRGWTYAFDVYNAGDRTPTSGEWVVEAGTGTKSQGYLADFTQFGFSEMLVNTGSGGRSLTDADVTRYVAEVSPFPAETSVSDIDNHCTGTSVTTPGCGTITWQSLL